MERATEVNLMVDIRLNRIRNVVGNFLYQTKALYIERDLIDFLSKIDKEHQEEVRVLNLRITEILSSR
jgi:hypothetical protein